MPSNHAVLSPSSAYRWTVCPRSVRLIATLPPEEPSVYAEEGTRAHEYAATCLKSHRDAVDVVPVEYSDMVEPIQVYLDQVRVLALGALHVEIEVKVDISGLTGEEGATGTADCILYFDDHIKVIDFKYGQGLRVSAVGNLQLFMYGWCAFEEANHIYGGLVWDPDRVIIQGIIIQPRITGDPSTHDFTALGCEELRLHVENMAEEAIKDDEPDFCPDENACRFCPAKHICPALEQTVRNYTQTEIKPSRYSEMLPIATLAKIWAAEVESRAYEYAVAGGYIDDYKLVYGRPGHKKWSNETAAEKALRGRCKRKVAEVFPRKLLSPAQARKLVGQDTYDLVLKEYVTQPEPSLKLVKESDPGKAVSVAERDGFPVAE